jgi:flagellar hook-basal body complex protein FliE
MDWSIESVAALAAPSGLDPMAAMPVDDAPSAAGMPGAFQALMQQGVGEVGSSVGAAEAAMRDLAAGKPIELHDVMISLERATLSVQTFMQIRNKLVEAYQDLMRMQM